MNRENNKKLAIITVVHNSEIELRFYFESIIKADIKFEQLIVVDSGSDNPEYLKRYEEIKNVCIIYKSNIGFCSGNNIAYSQIREDIDYVLFLNPDIIFKKNIIPNLIQFLTGNVWAVSALLKRYKIKNNKIILTNEIDSVGIYKTWYSRFFDSKEIRSKDPKALCGAFILADKRKLDDIKNEYGIFDESFFMYKEDIDLGLRALKKKYICKIHGEKMISRDGEENQ